MPWLFPGDGTEWIATEKVDGTSTTFTMKGYGRKRQFLVCSRNVVFDKPDKNCYYDTNVYLEMAEKYHMEDVMSEMMNVIPNLKFLTIQGETYGGNIQKRNYGDEHKLAIFNVIFGYENGEIKRLNPVEMVEFLDTWNLPGVPVVDEHFKIPTTCEELLEIATNTSKIDGGMREGIVIRSYDAKQSFKAVSNSYLIKYHG